MRLLQGKSLLESGTEAVKEATSAWTSDVVPEVILVFASTKQDPHEVAKALGGQFPKSLIVGCTTTGEHLNGEHLRGSLVLTGICGSGIRWSATMLEGLSDVTPEIAERAARSLYGDLGVNVEEMDPSDYFVISFIDGLRAREESVTSYLADALEGVRLVGGSAGDDLAFKETKVFFGEKATTNAVVLLMGHAKGRFEIIKHQHYTTTPRRLAITKVDTAARRVYEMDGMPALHAYAKALGMAPAAVTGDVTFMNPVTFSWRGEIYVRSIQQVHDDASITFFCGIEEGMVLEIGDHQDMVKRLADDVTTATASKGPFDLLVGCNCILRALETHKVGVVEQVGVEWKRAAKASIGFDTYGEQLDGLHINQTLVALAIRSAA